MEKTVEDYFPSRFLKSDDVKADTPVTISKIEEEKVGEDMKPIVYFEETDKGLVLNVTNARKIADIVGSDKISEWPGNKITLHTVLVNYRKEEVPAIRVKALATAGATASASHDYKEDWRYAG